MPFSVPIPANNYTIEPASWRDLGALRQLEKICFPLDAWPLFDLIGVLTFPGIVRLKAVCDEQMVGFIAGDPRRLEGIAWIATIGVLPERRGRGIAAALLKACEEQLPIPTIRLVVRASNDTAIRLYLRFGYTEISRWPRYYHDGENGVVMEKRR
jgi:ribosomal-protein-alanine N-acetyltransferase